MEMTRPVVTEHFVVKEDPLGNMRIKKCASIFHPSTKKTTSITTMTKKKKKISQLLLILLIDAAVMQLKHLHHLLMMEMFILLPDLHSLSLSGDLEVSQSH